MGPVQLISEYGLEQLGRYYSKYRGVVVSNEDPEGMGRVAVLVNGVSGSPIWAYSSGLDGTLGAGFKWITPKIGQIVWVEYEKGDPWYPVWSYHGWASNEMPEEFKDPNVFGFITPHGNKVVINDVDGLVDISIINNSNKENPTTISITEDKLKVFHKNMVEVYSDLISLNGDSEGLPMASNIVSKLNALEADINALKAAMKLAAPGVTVLIPTFSSVTAWSVTNSITPTVQSDLENEKVKQ